MHYSLEGEYHAWIIRFSNLKNVRATFYIELTLFYKHYYFLVHRYLPLLRLPSTLRLLKWWWLQAAVSLVRPENSIWKSRKRNGWYSSKGCSTAARSTSCGRRHDVRDRRGLDRCKHGLEIRVRNGYVSVSRRPVPTSRCNYEPSVFRPAAPWLIFCQTELIW